MKTPRSLLRPTLIALGIAALLATEDRLAASPPAMEIVSWKGGGLGKDADRPGADGAPSIKVAPKARAVLPLRESNESGKVTFHVYDDGTVAVPGKKNGVGPRWGIVQADGRVLVAGVMYARYLAEEGSLALMDVDPRVPMSWFNLKFVSGRAKQRGWQKWEFDFDPDAGLKISVNGRPLEKRRFDWSQSRVTGFTGLVLYGDETPANPQTLWVSGIDYTLGGPMNVQPPAVSP